MTTRTGRSARAAILGAALAPLLALATAGCTAGESPEASGPVANLVVVVIDTLRPDRLGAYGHPRATSPAIDALAAEGTLFEQALAVAPRTWQSFTSMLTGLYPPRHGVRHIWDKPVSKDTPMLSSLLRGAGYATAAFDGLNFLRGMTGETGFAEFIDDQSVEGSMLGDVRLGEEFVRWLPTVGKRPFFAFLRLGAPHWPYTCTPRFHETGKTALHAFNIGSQGLTLGHDGIELKNTDAYRELMYTRHAPEVIEHMHLHYDECVRESDGVVAAVVASLAKAGKLDDTILVVTSDHGESFGEHGYNGHGPGVDDTVMRVPLVVRFPAWHPAAGTRRVGQLVRLVDLMPTLAEAVGVAAPEGLDGQNLLPALTEGRALQLTSYGESGRAFVGVDPDAHLPGVAGKHRMLRTERWKLVLVPKAEGRDYRLYDLASEVGEGQDVAAQHPEVVAQLRAQLDPLVAADPEAGDRNAPTLGKEQEDQLRALGYL